MTTVIHISEMRPGDARIDRETDWGNPYIIGRDGTRAECIRKYRPYVLSRKDLMDRLSELRGRRLACWCKPKHACHGDVLVDLLETQTLDEFM